MLAKNLYWHDYLDYKEMDTIFKGGDLKNKQKVREYAFETDIADVESKPGDIVEPEPVLESSGSSGNLGDKGKQDDK